MTPKVSRQYRLALLTGAIAVTMIAGVVAYRTIPSADGTIHGCYNNRGALRVIDADAGENCSGGETAISWNQTGPQGPQGLQGLQGPSGPSEAYILGSIVAQVPLAEFPGVTAATLMLPQGEYILSAKFRYQGMGSTVQTATCVFQGDGTGGRDTSQNNVPPGGALTGQIDGFMMDWVRKQPGDGAEVRMQCFGPPDVLVINAQLFAVAVNLNFQ